MIEIVNLGQHPKYFDVFINELYAEFKSIFADIPMDNLRNQYWNSRQSIYIVLHNKTFIGCYSVTKCLIGDVYVHPRYRGKGIGKIIIADAKKRKWYCMKWELTTTTKNLGFYENQGFRIISSSKDTHHMVCYNRSAFILLASFVISMLLCVLFF